MPFHFGHYEDPKDDPIARVLFFSVILHYVVFFIVFGNPLLLILGDPVESAAPDKRFEVQLLSLPGIGGVSSDANLAEEDGLLGKGGVNALGMFPPKVESLGLFPQEVSIDGKMDGNSESRDSQQVGAPPVSLSDDPSRMPDFEKEIIRHRDEGSKQSVALKRDGTAMLTDEPIPLVTTKKLPPNMTGPEDCMIKVVSMVCPDGNAQCITAYKEFCASLPSQP